MRRSAAGLKDFARKSRGRSLRVGRRRRDVGRGGDIAGGGGGFPFLPSTRPVAGGSAHGNGGKQDESRDTHPLILSRWEHGSSQTGTGAARLIHNHGMLHVPASIYLLPFALLTLIPAVQTPTAAELVAKNIEARGGIEKLRAITSMRVTRTVGTPFSNVSVVMLRQRPGFLRIEQTPPGRPTVARIITPSGAWDETPQGRTARPAPIAAQLAEIDGDFDSLLVDYAQKGHRVEYAGIENAGGKPAHHLTVALRSGAERHVYLDAATFLERRHTGEFILPNNGTVKVIRDSADWRDVAGVKFPFAIDEDRDAMGQTCAIYVAKLEVNVPIDAAKFAPPAR